MSKNIPSWRPSEKPSSPVVRIVVTALFAAAVIWALLSWKSQSWKSWPEADSKLKKVNTRGFMRRFASIDGGITEDRLENCLNDLIIAQQIIMEDPVLSSLYEKRTENEGLLGGIEFVLAGVESRWKSGAVSHSWARWSLQTMEEAHESLEKQVSNTNFKQSSKEIATTHIDNRTVAGILYFAKTYYLCGQYFGEHRQDISHEERYQLTYMAYNMWYYRFSALCTEYDLRTIQECIDLFNWLLPSEIKYEVYEERNKSKYHRLRGIEQELPQEYLKFPALEVWRDGKSKTFSLSIKKLREALTGAVVMKAGQHAIIFIP